jgi:hypothetical protein
MRGGEVRAGRREGLGCGGGTTSGMHGEDGPIQGLGAKGTRGERTWNMPCMYVTLEVSKLSGWLKADATCRVEGEGMRCGGREVRVREAGGPVVLWRHDKRHARGWPDSQGLGAKGSRGERTLNIQRMSVTLEVSQPEMSALKFFKLWKR